MLFCITYFNNWYMYRYVYKFTKRHPSASISTKNRCLFFCDALTSSNILFGGHVKVQSAMSLLILWASQPSKQDDQLLKYVMQKSMIVLLQSDYRYQFSLLWESNCCLMSDQQFSAISWQELVTFDEMIVMSTLYYTNTWYLLLLC
jgi:hypothetical protein